MRVQLASKKFTVNISEELQAAVAPRITNCAALHQHKSSFKCMSIKNEPTCTLYMHKGKLGVLSYHGKSSNARIAHVRNLLHSRFC